MPAIKGEIQPEDAGRSVLFYPIIGLLIGILLYLPVLLFPDASSLLLAAIIVTLWAIITGGLHLDGLADSADAWLGGMGDNEKTQRIMKDPLVGAAGVIAIVCLILLKVAAISALLDKGAAGIIIIAPVIGRSLILLLFLSTPYVRSHGMANDAVNHLPKNLAIWITAICFLIGLLVSFWGLLAALIGFWLLRRLMMQRLGGCTGDTTGACVEVGEMLFLLGGALL